MTGEPGSFFEAALVRKAFRIDVRLAWDATSLVLFGASGSGKTSLLRVALGLEPTARVRLKLAGSWLDDAARGIRVPVHQRRLGWVPQSPTLFPDRSVIDNIEFGAHGEHAKAQIGQAIEVLELGGRLDSPISQLSGG